MHQRLVCADEQVAVGRPVHSRSQITVWPTASRAELAESLDQLPYDAGGEATLEVCGDGHADAVNDGLPDVGDRHAVLHQMALMLHAKRGAAAEDEREVFRVVSIG